MHESVSEINGIAIPSYYEFCINKYNSMTILECCRNPENMFKCSNAVTLIKFWETHKQKITGLWQSKNLHVIRENLLYITTIYSAMSSQYLFNHIKLKNMTG